MTVSRARHALAASLLGLVIGQARAASYDPDLTWRTLETPHFRISFHGGEEQLADEMADVAEQVFVEMTAELATTPRRRTEIVLVDNTDSANGYAMTLPINTIVIFVTAPQGDSTLSQYEDWNDAILTHEFTHILHLDTVEGLPRLLRLGLGRIVSVNRFSPGWIVEGLATFEETRHTNGGRGRSPTVDMIKRVTVLDQGVPRLGNLDGWQSDPPGGNLRYLFGQDLIQFVADRTGEQVWTDWTHLYGGWVPWWLPGRHVFGEGIPALYDAWCDEVESRYQRQAARIERDGLTPQTLLSDGEGSCAGATFSPDGEHLVWACKDPHDGVDIWMADGSGANAAIEVPDRFASDFTWRGDSQALAFSSLHMVSTFNLYEDVYFHELGGDLRSLTRGQRARDPAFSPDGQALVVVTNQAQDNQLARLTIDQRLLPLTDNHDHTQLSTPTFSPDGELIALSKWQHGQRDIWLYTAEGRPLRRLTADTASDLDPAWSADGRTLFFASDRSGVPNIYAIDLQTEHLWQVTNVLGGAFHPAPSPDGTRLVFESFTSHGTDIVQTPLDRASWRDRGLLPHPIAAAIPASEPAQVPVTPPAEQTTTASSRTRAGHRHTSAATSRLEGAGLTGLGGPLYAVPQLDEPDTSGLVDAPSRSDVEAPAEADYPFRYPVGRYKPLPSLLPPRYLAPAIYQTSYGFMGVLATGGVDTLRRYMYTGYLSYRTDSRYTGWGLSAAINRWLPVYTFGAYSYSVPYGDIYSYPGPPRDGGAWVPTVIDTGTRYWDRRVRAYARFAYPINVYQSVFGGWDGTLRQPLSPLDSHDYRPYLPTRGFLSAVSAGWRRVRGHSYAKSISPEDTHLISVVGRITHPLLGSYTLDDLDQHQPFTQVQLTGEIREYRTLPWLHNHVLAGRLAAGVAAGDTQRYGSYRLGGSFGDAAYYTLPDEWKSLRGFPVATVSGDGYYLASAEYRMPLLYVDRGVGVLPFFARYLSLSAFVDAGNAFDSVDGDTLGQTRVGTGAELRATSIVGWAMPINVRLGYAFAAYGPDGYSLGDVQGLYAWLGSSF